MSGETEPAAAAGHLSPDGYWWWNGTAWVPAAQAPPAAPAQAAAPRRPLPWLRLSAGAAAVVGVIATLVACILPYATFTDSTGGSTTTASVFSGGFSGAGWDIPEPVFAMLAAAAAATLVLIGINRLVQAISAGVLLAVGAQTATMWAAYFGVAAAGGSPGAGAVLGLAGAALILIGGLLALAALAARTAPEPAVAPAA